MKKQFNIALVGARGYVGFELIKLIDKHPSVQLYSAYSREYAGKRVCDVVPGFSNTKLCYCADQLESLQNKAIDVIFLALPNNVAAKYQ
ncbi:MAG TPA: N-acetyl-gamma-glutamyl-phosphate reductase, partial [Oceanospirillales bacterium]|nr:N-acetyl-gamma-glutamyl-phosphate reductase [Oceanospirillales bacterium]